MVYLTTHRKEQRMDFLYKFIITLIPHNIPCIPRPTTATALYLLGCGHLLQPAASVLDEQIDRKAAWTCGSVHRPQSLSSNCRYRSSSIPAKSPYHETGRTRRMISAALPGHALVTN